MLAWGVKRRFGREKVKLRAGMILPGVNALSMLSIGRGWEEEERKWRIESLKIEGLTTDLTTNFDELLLNDPPSP